jgi:hypothetical protein
MERVCSKSFTPGRLRVRTYCCWAILLGLGISARLWGAAPVELVGPLPSVPRLIEQLGDEDFRKRELANRLLRSFGPDVLPELRQAHEQADVEVRRRLDDLIGQFETAVLLAPKKVTLDVRQKPLREIFAEISRQTGYKIEPFGGNEQQPYTFHFDRVPFWQALDEISRTSGMMVQQNYGDNVVRLHAQDRFSPHVCYDGCFRLVANSIQQSRTIDFSTQSRIPTGAHRFESLGFNFCIFAEPKLPLLGVGEPRLEAVYDSEHNSMIPLPNGPEGMPPGGNVITRYGNGYRTFFQQTQLTLARPAEKAGSVKVLKGTLPVTLLTEEKPEVVTDQVLQAKGKKFKVANTSFAIEDVSETPAKQHVIKMSITDESKDGNPNDYTWVNSLYYRLELLDEKGAKFQVFGSNWGQSSPKHVQITFTYGAPGNVKSGTPSKLVYHVWTTMQTQVTFNFKDLPLP